MAKPDEYLLPLKKNIPTQPYISHYPYKEMVISDAVIWKQMVQKNVLFSGDPG